MKEEYYNKEDEDVYISSYDDWYDPNLDINEIYYPCSDDNDAQLMSEILDGQL